MEQEVSETIFTSRPTQRSSLLPLNKAFNVRSNHKELLYLSQFGRKEGCPITTSEETSPTAPTEWEVGVGVSENCIYKPMNVNRMNVYYSFTQHPGYL